MKGTFPAVASEWHCWLLINAPGNEAEVYVERILPEVSVFDLQDPTTQVTWSINFWKKIIENLIGDSNCYYSTSLSMPMTVDNHIQYTSGILRTLIDNGIPIFAGA